MEHGINGDVLLGERREDLCEKCGKVPAREGLTHCEECSVKRVGAVMRIYNERKKGRTMHSMREGAEGKDSSEMRGMSVGPEGEECPAGR